MGRRFVRERSRSFNSTFIHLSRSQVIALVRRNAATTRVFTFGLGDSVSHALVKGVARGKHASSTRPSHVRFLVTRAFVVSVAGGGRCEIVTESEDLQATCVHQLKCSLQDAVSQVSAFGHSSSLIERLTSPCLAPLCSSKSNGPTCR